MKQVHNKKSLEEWNSIFQKFNPNISIIKELGIKNKRRYVLCHCSDCEQDFERSVNKKEQGCPICHNKKLVVGINDMATTAPWMVEFLYDKSDAKKYMKSSSKRIWFKCKDCGNEEFLKINNVYNFGFSCNVCGDGISRPNKFMRALLLQLPLENIVFEYSGENTDKKKYDAYFEYNSIKYFIEMDGEQHTNDSQWGKAETQKDNDEYKNKIAKDNNIHLIRIPSFYLDYSGMINSFYECEIGELIKKCNINWNKCIENAEKNYVISICDYFNNNKNVSTEDIAKVFKINRTTVRAYLKKGAEFGLCNYDAKHPYKNHKKRKSEEDFLKDDIFYKICEYGTKNKDAMYSEFLSEFNIGKTKLKKYLKLGVKLGLTEYSYELMRKRVSKIANEVQNQKKPFIIEVYDKNIFINKYTSITKCTEELNILYPNKHYERRKIGSLLKENKEIIHKDLKFISLK